MRAASRILLSETYDRDTLKISTLEACARNSYLVETGGRVNSRGAVFDDKLASANSVQITGAPDPLHSLQFCQVEPLVYRGLEPLIVRADGQSLVIRLRQMIFHTETFCARDYDLLAPIHTLLGI